MIVVGNKINGIYLNNTEIKLVYLGNTIVYDRRFPAIPTDIDVTYVISTPTDIKLTQTGFTGPTLDYDLNFDL